VIAARIAGTGSAVLGAPRSTAELSRLALPDRDPAEIERRTGISTRHWIDPDATAAELAVAALLPALEAAGLAPRDLRRLVFVSSTGGDVLIPATANDVLDRLGLDGSCDAFDLNNSCAGFLTGLDLGARSVATGAGPVAVVAAETFSRYLSPRSPRPYLVLGDAAAAVILCPAVRGEGILATDLFNSAELRGRLSHAHPGRAARREPIAFTPSHEEMTLSAIRLIRASSARALSRAGLTIDEVAWVLPHQPNGEMLARIVEALGIDAGRIVPVVDVIGSVGAASIPTSLDRLLRTRPVRPGDRVLMVGVGGGTAGGAILYQSGGPT
jgi:3-oxoacyl-(acyl-carrier-protein) synthase III